MLSVGWWYVTEQKGAGDLRPYLLLQCLPLEPIPMWQFIDGAPRRDKVAFGCALALYVLAKVAELNELAIYSARAIRIFWMSLVPS